MKVLTLTLIAAFAFCSVNAQTFFEKNLGKPNSDRGYSVQQTTDGGYIIAGSLEQGTGTPDDAYLLKTDANGNEEWSKTFGSPNSDEIMNEVQQTADGGYIMVGVSYISDSNYTGDIYLIKTDGNGDTAWTKKIDNSDDDEGFSVKQTADGGYIIAAVTASGTNDVYIVKTDANGDTTWTKTYDSGDEDFMQNIQLTADGGYILAGINGINNGDVYLLKTDSNGDSTWTSTIGRAEEDNGASVQQTPDGGYIICGHTENPVESDFDIYLVKTDANGDSLWTKIYGDTEEDQGFSIDLTSDGGYILTGAYIKPFGSGAFGVILIKTNANGDTAWTKVFPFNQNDSYGYSVQQTSDDGYVVTGYTTGGSATGNNLFLIKTDCAGNDTFWNTALCPLSSTAPELKDKGVTVFPNPFSDFTTIRLSELPAGTKQLSVQVIDMFGKETVSSQINLSENSAEIKIKAAALSNGIYYCRVMHNNQAVYLGKLMVQHD